MFHQYDDTLITVPPVIADVDGKMGGAGAHSEVSAVWMLFSLTRCDKNS